MSDRNESLDPARERFREELAISIAQSDRGRARMKLTTFLEADVPSAKLARPDLRIEKKLWVEVETLRGLAFRGSSPFFVLENKLRRKRAAMSTCEQVWILFPRDVALLARHQVSAIVRNVAGDALDRFRLGFVDLHDRRPIFLSLTEPPRAQVRVQGISWRDARKPSVERRLEWKDVAGYADLKARLHADLLAPLVDPARYQSFGVGAPNGLLLYGLHTDEKRQVNELLSQLDRISGRSVVVVATTNYARGIDSAVRRSGRFDLKIPVLPPTEDDRREIFDYYLGADRLRGIAGIDRIDTHALAAATRLFTPSDIRCVVEGAVRRAIGRVDEQTAPALDTADLLAFAGKHPRTIQRDDATRWLDEARLELGRADAGLVRLEREVREVLGE